MRTFNCKLWTIAFGLCFSLSATTGVLAQQSVTITHTDLGSGIYMLKGQGGNIGLSVGADGAFMIDDQFAPLSNLLKAKVKELGSDSVNFVFNTHWHGDHTGGNENFSNSGSLIVAHKNVRKRLSTDQLMQAFNNTVNASPKEALPVITFANEINFHLNGEHIHVMHVKNAHTDGDAIIHFRNANVIHMGDTFFHGNYPFIDVSAGGTFKGLLKTIEKILALSDENTQIIPGHGALANKADLEKYQAMLLDIHSQFMALRKQGLSDEEIQDEGITIEYDAEWGNGFINPVKFIEIMLSDPSLQTAGKTLHKPDVTDRHEHAGGQSAAKH